MEFEKFTDRARGFIQSAQTLALRMNHQQLSSLHLLKVLLEDKEGLASGLIRAAGGGMRRRLSPRPKPSWPNCPVLREAERVKSIWPLKQRDCSIKPNRSRRNPATVS